MKLLNTLIRDLKNNNPNEKTPSTITVYSFCLLHSDR